MQQCVVVGAMEEHLNRIEEDQTPTEVLRLNHILGVALNASHSDGCAEVIFVHEEDFESWLCRFGGVIQQLHKVLCTIVRSLFISCVDEIDNVCMTFFVDISPVCIGDDVVD